jgi:hypothetical protein|tara:strand:- start:2355 stop:2600 length:246 start_codon:yes stop_codon:yes gene_type:complete
MGDAHRVDIHQTDLIFKDPIKCHEFRLSPDFQNDLRKRYKGMGVKYVRPYCKPTIINNNELLAEESNEQRIKKKTRKLGKI